MQITVEARSQYGNTVIHPVCDKAKLFASIAGTKTLTYNTLKQIKALGYIVTVKQNEVIL